MYFHPADAYLSRAEIYKKQGDKSLAIINYTLALRIKPTDDEIYFKRAQMYEEDDLLLAMDDYAKVSIAVFSLQNVLAKSKVLRVPF